jgi:hypothetical protein
VIYHSSTSLSQPIRTFLGGHRRCGWLAFDTAPLTDGMTFRLVLACYCGETFEALVATIGVNVDDVRALLKLAA